MNASAMNHVDRLATAVCDFACGRASHHNFLVVACAAGLSRNAIKDIDRVPVRALQDINNARAIVASAIGRNI